MYSFVSFSFEIVLTFSLASLKVFVFSFSIIMFGFTAMYFTGFPNFIIANPLFSKPSKTSYVLDLGTPEISAISPADATPLPSKANQTLDS